MFEVKFSNQATKYLKNLPENIKERIKDKFREIAKEPKRYLEPYEGEYYKIRIEDYRALVDVDYQNNILFVQVFDKRGRVYK